MVPILILVGILSSCGYIHGIVRKKEVSNLMQKNCDPDKSNYETKRIKNKKISGLYFKYNQDGCILQRGRLRKDRKVGLWEYYNNGAISSLIYYTKKDTVVWGTFNTTSW